MAAPTLAEVLIAQITDCHVVERGALLADRVDTAAGLRAAVDRIGSLAPLPDLVIATGDLVNDARSEQYDHLVELLAPLPMPIVAIPGNHDDRTELRRRFPSLPPGGPDEPIHHVVDGHEVRVVALDSTVPGEHGGRLGPTQLDWLDGVLADDASRPTLVALHHPPFLTGVGWMDEVGLADADALAAVIGRYRTVVAVVAGHVHRPVTTAFAGTVASCWPSTGAQVDLALDGSRYRYVDEPAAFALHRWDPTGRLTSHTCAVDRAPTWLPSWAADAHDHEHDQAPTEV